MADVIAIPDLESLQTEHVFYAYDGCDILLVSREKHTGRRFLISCCKLYTEWVIAEVSPTDLIRLIGNEASIRSLFRHRPVWMLKWDNDKPVLSVSNDPGCLPQPGATLDLNGAAVYTYRDELAKQV